MIFVLLFLSILPVFLLGRYIYNTDFEKEPKPLLIKLFLMGIGSVVLTLFLTNLLDSTFPFFETTNQSNLDIIELFLFVYIGVALIEEFSKWIFVRLFTYHHYEFNHAYDAIVYSVFVSLGFACIENIIYVLNFGMQTAIIRGITAVPGHACFGVLMGFYLGMAKTSDKIGNLKVSKKNRIKSLLFPILAHGTYDYLIFGSQLLSYLGFAFVIFVIYLFSQTIDKVKQLAGIRFDIREQAVTVSTIKPQYTYQYCPMCGEKVIGNFCIKCGYKHIK